MELFEPVRDALLLRASREHDVRRGDDLGMRVRHRDSDAGPLDHPAVVLPVSDRSDLFARDAEGKLVSVWEMPTGWLVDQGVAIDIGAEKPLVIPYRACDTRQCQAAANLGEPFVKELVAAEKVSVSVVATNGRRVAFSLSAKGLEEALAALSQ